MPELPEVEMERRYAEAHVSGRRIAGVAKMDTAVLEGVSRASLQRALTGRRFISTRRHGKWLFLQLNSGAWLVLHFGMTGGLVYVHRKEVDPRFVRFRVDFQDGSRLCFTDSRKFGRISLADAPEVFLAAKGWGPDPTLPGFDRETFRARLRSRKGLLKSVLLNQQVIAGIGNLYADEMLFQAGLHPNTRAADLRLKTLDALYDAMMDVFAASLAVGTDYDALPERFLLRRRNSGGQCPKCGRILSTMSIGGRTTAFCAVHQRRRR